MRKYLVAGVLVLILLVSTFYNPVKQTLGIVKTPQSPLEQILEESPGDFYELSIFAWAKINSKYLSVDEMKGILQDVSASTFNSQANPKFHIEENYKSAELLLSISPNKSLQLLLQTYQPTERTSELTPESYFLVELAQNNNDYSLAELKQEINSLYRDLNVTPQLNITYTTKVKGKITSAEAQSFFAKAKAILHLQNIEETSTADFYNLSGYSKLFKEEIIIAEQKRNFSINIRYNVMDDETYILFGTPDIGGQ